MKKFTRLLSLALALSGTAATAQEPLTSLDQVTEGWYQIKNVAGNASILNHYASSLEEEYEQTINSTKQYYPLEFVATPSDEVLTYFYLKPTGSAPSNGNGKFFVQMTSNGRYLKYNACASETAPTSNQPNLYYDETGFRFISNGDTDGGWAEFNPDDSDHTLVGFYSRGKSGYKYALYKVDPTAKGLTAYRVLIDGYTNTGADIRYHAKVTCSNTNVRGLQEVYNHGTFFFPSNVTPTATEFALSQATKPSIPSSPTDANGRLQAGYYLNTYPEDPSITDADPAESRGIYQKVITFAPVASEERMTELRAYAQAKLGNITSFKVGYPGTAATKQAIVDALAELDNTYDKVTALVTALNNFSSTIYMPEDGHAYVLHNLQQGTSEYLLTVAGNGQLGTTLMPASTENIDNASIFVCHKVSNNEYTFSNASNGKFLVWKGIGSGYNSDTGFTDSYYEKCCKIKLESHHSTKEGAFTMVIYRNAASTQLDGTFIIMANGTFNAWGTGADWSGTAHSNLFRLEEVPYYNKVTLRTPTTPEEPTEADGYKYATLYLPFATTIPDGVEAYTARLPQNGSKLALLPVSGGVLPACEPVVLRKAITEGSSDGDETVLFVPATTTGTKDASNGLKGVSKPTLVTDVVTTGATVYVLNGAFTSGIGFYPYTATNLPEGRAYYEVTKDVETSSVPEVAAGIRGLLFDFGGEATALQTVTTDASAAKAVYYDLSGRRVTNPARGIYILNGRKVILK